jgi:hypothetical protein
MFYKMFGNADSGGALSVKNQHIFASSGERDTYFSNNPSELIEGLTVTVAGTLQKRTGSNWADVSAVIKGQTGSAGTNGTNAPLPAFNYSADGLTGWSATLNPALHKYWRWSTDGGVTWLPEPPAVARYTASADGGGVPAPFEYVVSPEGRLQLMKGAAVIMESDEYGSWIVNSVSTGTGSLHLGDLHSIGSANENVIFKNEDSTLAWHPCWGAISADGTQVIEQSARVHSGAVQIAYPAGTVGTATINYNSTFTTLSDAVFLFLDVIPKESYTGKLTLTVTKSSNGKEISKFEYDAAYVSGNKSRVPFKYPLWMFAGQQFSTSIKKPNGDFLQVTANIAGSEPYREASFRSFANKAVFHAGNAALQATALNALTGADRISAAAIRDMPIMSGTVAGVAKIGTTMSVNGDGELNTSISPTGIKIVANQAARLAITVTGGAILAIQQDNGFTYGIEANQDPATLANWKQIGTVATSVVSFNGRNGAVLPAAGDYSQKQIKTIHDVTLVEGFFGIDNDGIYWDDGV